MKDSTYHDSFIHCLPSGSYMVLEVLDDDFVIILVGSDARFELFDWLLPIDDETTELLTTSD